MGAVTSGSRQGALPTCIRSAGPAAVRLRAPTRNTAMTRFALDPELIARINIADGNNRVHRSTSFSASIHRNLSTPGKMVLAKECCQ